MTPVPTQAALWTVAEAAAAHAASAGGVSGKVVVDDMVLDQLAAEAATTGVLLELVDLPPGRGQRCRFYSVHLQPSLFGGVDVIREWGRVGTAHRPRRLCSHHPDTSSTLPSLRRLLHRRLRRGYRR